MSDKAITSGKKLLSPTRLWCFLLAALAVSLSGPFGTFKMPLLERAAYWVPWLALVWLVTALVFEGVDRKIPDAGWRPLVRNVTSFVMTLPIAAVCAVALATLFFPKISFTADTVFREAQFLAPFVAGIIGLHHISQPARTPNPTLEPEPRLDWLPAKLGRELIQIQVIDHYLHIETKLGKHVTFGSLADASADLSKYPGLRVHRTHWVALDAIKSRSWRGSSMELKLTNGAKVPVGRAYRKTLLARLKAQ